MLYYEGGGVRGGNNSELKVYVDWLIDGKTMLNNLWTYLTKIYFISVYFIFYTGIMIL